MSCALGETESRHSPGGGAIALNPAEISDKPDPNAWSRLPDS